MQLNVAKGEVYKVGTCEFKPTTSQHTLQSLLSLPIRKILEREQWNFGDRQFRDLDAKQLFTHLLNVYTKILWLDFNKKASIIADIVGPQYPVLQVLYLGDNNIYSIEALQFLQAPKIEKLYLNHNRIVNIKHLRRVGMPKIKEINLNGNPIVDEHWLCECKILDIDKLNLGYANKCLIFESNWFMKAEIKTSAQISSARTKLATFTKMTYLNALKQDIAKRKKTVQGKQKAGPVVNLFKTFQS